MATFVKTNLSREKLIFKNTTYESNDYIYSNGNNLNGQNGKLNGNNSESDITLITYDNSKVHIAIGGTKLSYNYLWLRDACRCTKCYNFKFNLRSLHLLDIPEDIRPSTVYTEDGDLHIIWIDGHHSVYTPQFLLKHNYKSWLARQKRKLVFWRGDEVKDKVAAVTYENFMQSNETLKKVMESILIYGVAFIDGVENTEAETEKLVRRIGPPQETLFGVTWSISTENKVFQDAAFTNNKITFHNDCTYYTESTGLVAFHLLEAAKRGGDTVLIDAFDVIKRLESQHPEDVRLLSTKKIGMEYCEEGYSFRNSSAVIKYNEFDGEVEQIRYNVNDRSPLTSIPEEETFDYFKAYRRLAKEFDNKDCQWWFSLKPGRVLLFDNWRLIHGRSEFEGKRYLCGSFISRTDWLSRARVLGLID